MKEFCPTTCGNTEKNDDICFANPCYYTNDRILDEPIPVKTKQTRDIWIDGFIVGRNGKDFILGNLSRVNKNSPLIKR